MVMMTHNLAWQTLLRRNFNVFEQLNMLQEGEEIALQYPMQLMQPKKGACIYTAYQQLYTIASSKLKEQKLQRTRSPMNHFRQRHDLLRHH
eukprot:c24380_g2_i7 orf=100-372(+)